MFGILEDWTRYGMKWCFVGKSEEKKGLCTASKYWHFTTKQLPSFSPSLSLSPFRTWYPPPQKRYDHCGGNTHEKQTVLFTWWTRRTKRERQKLQKSSEISSEREERRVSSFLITPFSSLRTNKYVVPQHMQQTNTQILHFPLTAPKEGQTYSIAAPVSKPSPSFARQQAVTYSSQEQPSPFPPCLPFLCFSPFPILILPLFFWHFCPLPSSLPSPLLPSPFPKPLKTKKNET